MTIRTLFLVTCGTLLTVVPDTSASQRIVIQSGTNVVCYYEGPTPGVAATADAVFSRVTPSSRDAEKVLRSCLDAAIARAPDRDIMATAWANTSGREGDERIVPLSDGARHLSYTARTRVIATWKEREGTKTQVRQDDSSDFFVEYEEQAVLTRPGEKFATVRIVFKKPPDKSRAYEILLKELKRAVSGRLKKWPTSAYVFVGDRSNPAGQKQIMDSDGAYIFANYDPASGQITRRGRTLDSLAR